MDTSGALSTIGVLVCVGAVVVIALLVFAFRALTNANRRQGGQDMWNKRGPEQPRIDNPDIESRGGFGGVPNTGMDREVDLNRDPNINRGSTSGSSGFGGAQTYNQDRDRKRRDDDDDVRSSGGFGGG